MTGHFIHLGESPSFDWGDGPSSAAIWLCKRASLTCPSGARHKRCIHPGMFRTAQFLLETVCHRHRIHCCNCKLMRPDARP